MVKVRLWWRRSGRDKAFVLGGLALLVGLVLAPMIELRAVLAVGFVILGWLWD